MSRLHNVKRRTRVVPLKSPREPWRGGARVAGRTLAARPVDIGLTVLQT